MTIWIRLKQACRAVFRRRDLESEMREEMQAHREAQVEANLAAGMSPREARRVANLQFGPADAIAEESREARGFMWLSHLGQDLRYGGRMLLKHKAFSIIAILTLALGLSANMTIFGMIDALFFQPLGVRDADRLAVVSRYSSKGDFAPYVSWADYQDYRDNVPAFSDTVALAFRPVHLARKGQPPRRSWIEAVSSNYFRALGATPAHGRLLLPGEGETMGADPVVVLSHHYWVDQLGADPGIVGGTVEINGSPLTVIGVAAPEFTGVQWSLQPAGWIPATMMPTVMPHHEVVLTERSWAGFRVFGYLAPGVDIARATAELAVVDARLRADQPRPDLQNIVTQAIPEQRSRPEPSVSGFLPLAAAVFLGLVLLILLIACANVANLLFARAAARQRELGIRAAVGASRGRLTRQLLTESLLLSCIAGMAGWFLSLAASKLLERLTPTGDVPMAPDAAQGTGWIVVFAIVISLLAGIVTGLLPALRATRLDVQAVIKGGTGTGGRERHRLRNILVISQVAFCAIVLVAGGLFLRSLNLVANMDLGFDPDNLALAAMDLDMQGYEPERGQQFLDRLTTDLEALPGVTGVTLASAVPLNTSFQLRAIADENAAVNSETGQRDGEVQAGRNVTDENYLAVMRVMLVRGRGFLNTDVATSPRVAVINEALAEKLWPGQDPIGRRFKSGWEEAVEVVGVVRTGKYVMLNEAPRPYYYQPLAQAYEAPMVVHVRTRGDPVQTLSELRQVMLRLDPALPIFEVRTMTEHLRGSAFGYMPLRMAAFMSGAQGLVGLLLAIMGVYGVVAYSVSQRSREIGIRLALGADRGDVFRLVVSSGLRLILIGLVAGLLVAFGFSNILAGLLVGLNPLDLPVFGGVTLLLVAVSFLACYLPARRAMAIDPAVTLKCE